MRILVPVFILGWLSYRLLTDDRASLAVLFESHKDYGRLAAAQLIYLAAVLLTFVRWYLLVTPLGLPFHLMDAIRLGFVGYLFQFASLGAVGGDLFKAAFLAHEQPRRRPEAIATILIDRMMGLLSLLLLACLVFPSMIGRGVAPQFQTAAKICFAVAAIGAAIFLFLLFAQSSLSLVAQLAWRTPKFRATLLRVQASFSLYRAHRLAVTAALVLGMVTHAMQAAALYLASTALFSGARNLAEHLGIWVIAASAGALPIAPAGLGTFDLTFKFLYEQLASTLTVANEGFLVAMMYRVMCLVVAGIGVGFYWMGSSRTRLLPARSAATPDAS